MNKLPVKWTFRLQFNEEESQTFTTEHPEKFIEAWYWHYDPMRLMPILRAITILIALTISFPFLVIGVISRLVAEFCSICIYGLKAALADNYTILNSIPEIND